MGRRRRGHLLDPAEAHDLFDPAAPRVARARESIRALAARAVLERADDERRASGEDMAALGYAAAGSADAPVPGPLEDLDLPAPADRLAEHYRTWEALAMADVGKFSAAIDALREIADANPARAYAALGRTAEALAETDRYLELCPGDEEALRIRESLLRRLPPD